MLNHPQQGLLLQSNRLIFQNLIDLLRERWFLTLSLCLSGTMKFMTLLRRMIYNYKYLLRLRIKMLDWILQTEVWIHLGSLLMENIFQKLRWVLHKINKFQLQLVQLEKEAQIEEPLQGKSVKLLLIDRFKNKKMLQRCMIEKLERSLCLNLQNLHRISQRMFEALLRKIFLQWIRVIMKNTILKNLLFYQTKVILMILKILKFTKCSSNTWISFRLSIREKMLVTTPVICK